MAGLAAFFALWAGAVYAAGGSAPAADAAEESSTPAEPAAAHGEDEEGAKERTAKGDNDAGHPARDEAREQDHDDEEPHADGPFARPEGEEGPPKKPPKSAHAARGPEDSGDKDPKTKERRVRQAASEFVLYAYGYTGNDVDEYTSNLYATLSAPEDFYLSPGSETVRNLVMRVEQGGTRRTARLDGFEVSKDGVEKLTGVARFTVEGPEDAGSYEQKLELVKWGAIWKIASAHEMKEV